MTSMPTKPRTPEPFQRPDRTGYWFWFKDEHGRWRQRRGGDTAGECWLAIAAKEQSLAKVRAGLLTAAEFTQAQHTRRPIAEVLGEFEKHLRGQRAGAAHIAVTIGDICAVFGVPDPDQERRQRRENAKHKGYKPSPLNWHCLGDINASDFSGFLDDVGARRSANRRNRYRASLMQLVIWAVDRRGWLMRNPLTTIEALNEDRDRRRVRRALTQDEFWALLDHCTDPHRKLYYWLAGRLGLRWSEIHRLERRHVDLGDAKTGADACVQLTADMTKNGRDAVLPIDPDLALALRGQFGLVFAGRLFPTRPTRMTFKADLERAGVAYKTDEGYAYRGALRTTFGTALYEAGVDLRTAQELMRHSDPKLTAKVYQRVRLRNTRPAVEALRRPPASPAKTETA